MYLLLPSTHDFIVDIRKSNSDILEILYMTLVYLFNGNYEEGKLNWLLSSGDKIQEIRSVINAKFSDKVYLFCPLKVIYERRYHYIF